MNEKMPALPSARIMTCFRLYRSAATPPKGLKRATGKRAAIDANESHIAEEVVSVMYHIAAKLAATVAKIESA